MKSIAISGLPLRFTKSKQARTCRELYFSTSMAAATETHWKDLDTCLWFWNAPKHSMLGEHFFSNIDLFLSCNILANWCKPLAH
jgi:hypothetical protein